MRIPIFRVIQTHSDDSQSTIYFPTKTTAERYQQENKKNADLKDIGKWEKIEIKSKQLLCCWLSDEDQQQLLSQFLKKMTEKGILGQA